MDKNGYVLYQEVGGALDSVVTNLSNYGKSQSMEQAKSYVSDKLKNSGK